MRILETLICSGEGEPLYDADCADVHARVAFLKKIAEQAAELGQILPLGNFDRLEMRFSDARTVAQARPDRLVFVRTANPPPSP